MTQYKIILIIRGISCSIFILNPTHPPPLLKKIRRWLGMVACVLYVNDSSSFSYLFNILTMTSFAYLFAERNSHHPRHNNSRVLLISRHPSLVWCSHFCLASLFFDHCCWWIIHSASSTHKTICNLRVRLSFSLSITVCCWLSNRTNEWMDQKHHNSKLFRHRIFYRYIDTMCHVVQW